MQAVIANILKGLTEEGLTSDQVTLYFQGMLNGMQLICTQIKGNKHPIRKDETDPMFVHNWNFIIDQLATLVDGTVSEIRQSLQGEKNGSESRNR